MNINLIRAVSLVVSFCVSGYVFAASPPSGPAAQGVNTSPVGGVGGSVVTIAKTNQKPDLFASANASNNNTVSTSKIVEFVYTLSTGVTTPVK